MVFIRGQTILSFTCFLMNFISLSFLESFNIYVIAFGMNFNVCSQSYLISFNGIVSS